MRKYVNPFLELEIDVELKDLSLFAKPAVENLNKLFKKINEINQGKKQYTHCLGTLAWIKKSSLSRDHNCDQNYAKPDSKLITEIKDKLQVSANRGRITWLTWNLLGTLY